MQPLAAERTIPARQNTTQQTNTIRGTVNYSDGSAAMQFGTLPQGAFITGVILEVVTAFNAATTNVLTFGTTAANANEIVNATDVSEAAAAVNLPGRGLGRALAATGDVGLWAKYTQSGTAATAGQAEFVITYVPNNG